MTRFMVSNWQGKNELSVNGVFDSRLEIDESFLLIYNKQNHVLVHLPVNHMKVETEKE